MPACLYRIRPISPSPPECLSVPDPTHQPLSLCLLILYPIPTHQSLSLHACLYPIPAIRPSPCLLPCAHSIHQSLSLIACLVPTPPSTTPSRRRCQWAAAVSDLPAWVQQLASASVTMLASRHRASGTCCLATVALERSMVALQMLQCAGQQRPTVTSTLLCAHKPSHLRHV